MLKYTLIVSETSVLHFNIRACAEIFQSIYGGNIIENL